MNHPSYEILCRRMAHARQTRKEAFAQRDARLYDKWEAAMASAPTDRMTLVYSLMQAFGIFTTGTFYSIIKRERQRREAAAAEAGKGGAQ